jgi:RimJ/RimL family protein N-acetyltransferase
VNNSTIFIERSFDYVLIKAIMSHPGVYRNLVDDFSPAAADFRPIESDLIWYLVAWDGNQLLGLWMLVPQNGICCEIHTVLLPHAWGDRARRAANEALAWIWTNTPCRRIITNVPAENRLAYHFALAAGLEVYGTNEASFLRNGRLQDQICLGISRPRELPLFEAGQETTIPDECSPVAASLEIKEG